MLKLTEKTGKEILLGGWFLGGGGGGLPEGGQEVLELVLHTGEVQFVPMDRLAPDDVVVTASLVGSPASKTAYVGTRTTRMCMSSFCVILHRRSLPLPQMKQAGTALPMAG